MLLGFKKLFSKSNDLSNLSSDRATSYIDEACFYSSWRKSFKRTKGLSRTAYNLASRYENINGQDKENFIKELTTL